MIAHAARRRALWSRARSRPPTWPGSPRCGVDHDRQQPPRRRGAGPARGAEIDDAAGRRGSVYRYMPVAGGIVPEQVEAMAEVLGEAEGKLLLFCRSGTRSAFLWALAQRGSGLPATRSSPAAPAAGYDLRPIRSLLP